MLEIYEIDFDGREANEFQVYANGELVKSFDTLESAKEFATASGKTYVFHSLEEYYAKN